MLVKALCACGRRTAIVETLCARGRGTALEFRRALKRVLIYRAIRAYRTVAGAAHRCAAVLIVAAVIGTRGTTIVALKVLGRVEAFAAFGRTGLKVALLVAGALLARPFAGVFAMGVLLPHCLVKAGRACRAPAILIICHKSTSPCLVSQNPVKAYCNLLERISSVTIRKLRYILLQFN